VRRTFREKAFLGRQEALLRRLLARARCYFSARGNDGGPFEPVRLAFTTLDGADIPDADLIGHLRAIRRIGGSAQANAELCRIQLEARYAGAAAGEGTAFEGTRMDEPPLPAVVAQMQSNRTEGGSGAP
jgi:hypothetical protein